jgi:hypothetical protein
MAEDEDMLDDVDVSFWIISGHDGRNLERVEQGKRSKNSSENSQHKCKRPKAEKCRRRLNLKDDGLALISEANWHKSVVFWQ